ncbi:MAG: UDP-2,3-diacylglucosamine diphosphatase [Bacteroidales bacterium]
MVTIMEHYPVLVLSDIHLGSEYSRIRELNLFLEKVSCDLLILNGDIIDGWQLRKSGRHLTSSHLDFFRILMAKIEDGKTKIVYVRGNHDDFLDKILPFRLPNFTIVSDYLLTTSTGLYYVTHGDLFDSITTQMRWLSLLGDAGYTVLLHLNKYYNLYRQKRGMPYRSFSRKIKGKIKSAVSYISDFEEKLVMIARMKKVNGIICGHIHQAANLYYDSINYLNSGDWVESLTALAFTQSGEWIIIHYDEWRKSQHETEKLTCFAHKSA